MVVMWLPLILILKIAFELKTTPMYVKDLEIQSFKVKHYVLTKVLVSFLCCYLILCLLLGDNMVGSNHGKVDQKAHLLKSKF
jgi:hypothetical protein